MVTREISILAAKLAVQAADEAIAACEVCEECMGTPQEQAAYAAMLLADARVKAVYKLLAPLLPANLLED